MKLGEVRSFFKTNLESLDLREWADGFNTANIPATVINGSFHIMIGNMALGAVNMQAHDVRMQIGIQLFFRGYRYPQDAKDAGLNKAQEVLNQLLKPSVRVNQSSELKDIRPVSVIPRPLAESNDNSLILDMVFECFLLYRFS